MFGVRIQPLHITMYCQLSPIELSLWDAILRLPIGLCKFCLYIFKGKKIVIRTLRTTWNPLYRQTYN